MSEERLAKVMRHVAAHTNDEWARDYLIQRLGDFGHHATFRQPQDANSGINKVIGHWPGDETDEEIKQGLNQ